MEFIEIGQIAEAQSCFARIVPADVRWAVRQVGRPRETGAGTRSRRSLEFEAGRRAAAAALAPFGLSGAQIPVGPSVS